MPRRPLRQSSGNNSKKGQIRKISTRLSEIKQSNTQKQIPNAKYRSSSGRSGIIYYSKRKFPRDILVLKIDLKYAYSQIPLDNSIAKHCNFSILGGKATGTHRFLNGFYGLTDMPATFQKTIDKTLEGISSKFAFLDDILVITKGSIREHENELDNIFKKLNSEGLAINLQKCEFAKTNIEWLGFTITTNGIKPLITKTEAITKLDNPKTLKQLRSFLGSVHHVTKFIPKLAKLSEPLRPLLKKNPRV